MWSSYRDRILRICRSPFAFGGALLAVAFLAAAAFPLSSREGSSLADYVLAVCLQRFPTSSATETSYLSDNISAMRKMVFDMGVRPSGDIDRDFVAMMTPHHQGAVEMARAELRYGQNEQLRRMAQEIIVTQLEEIAAMRLAVGLPLSVPPDATHALAQSDAKAWISPDRE